MEPIVGEEEDDMMMRMMMMGQPGRVGVVSAGEDGSDADEGGRTRRAKGERRKRVREQVRNERCFTVGRKQELCWMGRGLL